MVQMKIDLKGSGVDVNKSNGFEPYDGPKPQPGVYAAVVERVTVRVSQAGNQYFNVLFLLADQNNAEKQKYKGYPHWEKITPGDSDFQKERVAKLLHALSGKDPSKVSVPVTHDPVTDGGLVTKVGGKNPIGAKVKLVLRRGEVYNDEVQMAMSDLFKWPDDVEWPSGDAASSTDADLDEEDVEEDEDEVEEDEVEEEETDEDEDEDEEEDLEAQFEARQEELGGMTRTELKAVLKEHGTGFKVLKRHTDDDLVNAILDIEWPAEEAEDEESDEASSDEPPF